MRPLAPRRLIAAVSIAVAAAAGLLVPAAAQATEVEACEITGGDITWGFKESFRSYISGTIARGEWTTADGATYATPSFGFTGATGTYEDGIGTASFPGTIAFTGHDGLLQTSVSNPTIAFTGPGTAQLLVDVSTVPMEQAMAGDTTVHTVTQIPFVDIDLAAATVTADGIAATDAATAITAEGFAAFGNYDAGSAFDPISFTLATTCATPEATPEATAEATTDATAEAEADAAPDAEPIAETGPDLLLPIVGGVFVLVAVAAVIIVARRRKSAGIKDAGTKPADTNDAGTTAADTQDPGTPEA